MVKKAPGGYMTRTECIGGTIFFLVYLLAMPLLLNRVFNLAEVLLDAEIGGSLRNALYYYVLFAVTVLLFHRFLARTTSRFFDELARSIASLGVGLVVFYGANELVYRVFGMFFDSRTNLNDTAIAAQVGSAPHMTALITVLLAPFVEEVLFRGLVFGCVKEKSRVVAYALSAVLFAFLHVWAFALSGWDLSRLLVTAQYLAPGLVFAWVFDRSGTLWTSIALHAAVNALVLLV